MTLASFCFWNMRALERSWRVGWLPVSLIAAKLEEFDENDWLLHPILSLPELPIVVGRSMVFG